MFKNPCKFCNSFLEQKLFQNHSVSSLNRFLTFQNSSDRKNFDLFSLLFGDFFNSRHREMIKNPCKICNSFLGQILWENHSASSLNRYLTFQNSGDRENFAFSSDFFLNFFNNWHREMFKNPCKFCNSFLEQKLF